ncbi:MAG: hypothetical protein HRT80_02225 [Henriciella sp.]|nr:hypothetical protein [Henriciella sp.]
MMPRLSLATAALVIGLTACSSTPDLDPQEARARMLAMAPAIDSVPSSGLGPQEVSAGECALFLWSQTDTSKFIFFSKALSGTAVFAQGEIPMDLIQTGAGGDIFGQFNTETRYISDDGREIALEVVPGERMNGGQRVEQGLISLTDKEGWLTKLPVLGVRACQPE